MEDVKTYSELLAGHLPRLNLTNTTLDKYEKENPYKPTYTMVDKATFLGIECEIENVYNNYSVTPYFKCIEDGSLRNGGREFVSLPIKASRVEQALHTLFSNIDSSYEYSERTSTHVHMNIRTLTPPQLESLILTYMVFEKAMFHWVGQDREDNIFCVPLYNINLINNLCVELKTITNLKWTKYTALNLAPILQKGTIEFRHLYGTDSIYTITTWINMLLSLKLFALRNDPAKVVGKILTLNSTSEYSLFCKEVFGDLSNILSYNNFNKDMSFCISNIKSRCLYNIFGSKIKDNLVISKLGMFMRSNKPTYTTEEPHYTLTYANRILGNPLIPRYEEDDEDEPHDDDDADDGDGAIQPMPNPLIQTMLQWRGGQMLYNPTPPPPPQQERF